LEFYAISEETSHVVYFSELFQENIEYKKKFLNVSNRRKGISPTTIRRYERDYNNYIAGSDLDNSEIAKITTISLELMLVKIIESHDLSEKCASNMLSYVCQAFKFAVRNRYLENDPSEFIDRRLILSRCRIRPAKDDSERVLTFKELTALRQAVLRHEAEYPDYIADYAIELAMLTGMRVGELAALHWNDIDDDWIHVDYSEHRLDYSDKPSEIVVGEPKNYKHRKIPMTDDIQALFNKVKRLGFNSFEGYVFCRKDGERCTAHSISSAVTRRADEAGIKKTSIHEIRRTVSSYLRQELPIKAVASMPGHLETTNEICYNYDMSEKAEKTRALRDLSSKLIKFCPESQKQKKTGSA
jgi:integrase